MIEKFKETIDRQEQYSCRICLLLHSTGENVGENTDNLGLKTARIKY